VSVSFNAKEIQEAVPSAQYDVVVLGAGPYGLSVSAHLLGQGLKVATFGKPLSFWRNHMPDGMLLRSYWWATNLSDPQQKYTFAKYFEEKGIQPVAPLAREIFIDYGLWFQQHAVPDIDETYIQTIEHNNNKYYIKLEDGRFIISNAVVLAPGLHYYRYSPQSYAHMPGTLVSHSSDYSHFKMFAQKKVAIIGGGQGALESAALLQEQGCNVHVFYHGTIHWLTGIDSNIPAWLQNIRAPQAGMGNGWLNVILEKYPYMLYWASRARRNAILKSLHGPAGSEWLRPRLLGKVDLRENTSVAQIKAVNENENAQITLTNGEEILFDHVILGTGYRADVKDLPMLDQHLKDSLRTYRGSPVLSNWFESNIAGLYFIGFSGARSFGPLYRFVVGADAAARRTASAVARQVARSR
jgi:lysine/ornithine N-monooxygenase